MSKNSSISGGGNCHPKMTKNRFFILQNPSSFYRFESFQRILMFTGLRVCCPAVLKNSLIS